MSKKIELIHAEVITQYNSDQVLREFNTDKGATIFSWSVRTKINDKAEKSPLVFDNCSLFAENDELKQYIRSNVINGAIVDIKGYADRRKGTKQGTDGKFPYFDQINVKEITPITGVTESSVEPSDDNLPF